MKSGSLSDLVNSHKTQQTAIILSGRKLSLTYGEFAAQIDALASRLNTVKRADVVALALPNGIELITSFLAITSRAAVAAPLNPGYTQAEFEFYLNDTRPVLLLVPQGYLNSTSPTAVVAAARKLNIPLAEVSFSITTGTSLNFGAASGPAVTHDKARKDDVALILHTSGTTGRPKAVPLTHENLLTTANNVARTYELSSRDNTYLVQVLFHIHGIVAAFLAPLVSGGTITIPDKFDPSKTWAEFSDSRCTWITAVPSILQILLYAPRPPVLPIRFIRSCSSPLSPSTLHQLEERFSAPVLEAYAMTENAHQMTSNPLPNPADPPASWRRKPGTVGLPQGVEVRIYNGETVLGVGQHGDVCIRGPSVTLGYINNEKANRESFIPDTTNPGALKFFRTGDRGFLDSDGFLTLVGRNSEIINRGGEKISPIEVDAALLAASTAVREAVSFAVPDDLLGQEVEAAVVVDKKGEHLDEGELQTRMRKVLADFKIPKRIHFFDKAIPKGPTGKIQRKNLTAQFGSKKPTPKTTSLDHDKVAETVKMVLATELRVDISAIKDEALLFELGADSITFIRLIGELRKANLTVAPADLFANPSVSRLIQIILTNSHDSADLGARSAPSRPDPNPFSTISADAKAEKIASELASQLGLKPEDIVDAFPLTQGSQFAIEQANLRVQKPTSWIGEVHALHENVNLEKFKEAWSKVHASEYLMHSTLGGKIASQNFDYYTIILRPELFKFQWNVLEVTSKADALKAKDKFAEGLRHSIGMRTSHLLLIKYGPRKHIFGFLASHIFFDAPTRELLQRQAVLLYNDPNHAVRNLDPAPWARYVRHSQEIVNSEKDSWTAYWNHDFAPTRRLRDIHQRKEWQHTEIDSRSEVVDVPLSQVSTSLGVSVPVISESAFVLAVSLFWSQIIGGGYEPATYLKSMMRRYEIGTETHSVRGMPTQFLSSFIPVDAARHSIWHYVNTFNSKMRATETIEQTAKVANSGHAFSYFWKVAKPDPLWNSIAPRLLDSLWPQPFASCDIAMRLVAKDKLMIAKVSERAFDDEYRSRGCRLDVVELTRRVLDFYSHGELDRRDYEDLRAAVFGRPLHIDARL